MTTQRYEIEAWLGDDHGLTDEQIVELTRISDEIAERYPDPDDHEEREAALTAAYRLLIGDGMVIRELAEQLHRARHAEAIAGAGLRQAALMVVKPNSRGEDSEAGFGRRVGVNRMTVRNWLGKPPPRKTSTVEA